MRVLDPKFKTPDTKKVKHSNPEAVIMPQNENIESYNNYYGYCLASYKIKGKKDDPWTFKKVKYNACSKS